VATATDLMAERAAWPA